MTISCLSLWQWLELFSEKYQVIQRFQLQITGLHIYYAITSWHKNVVITRDLLLFPIKIPYAFFTCPIQTTCAAISLFLI